jgi:ABC-type multidrug transport system ATPase subunit
VNPDAEATDAAPAAPASESEASAAPGGVAPSGDRVEQPARRPTARRKPVPPVHGGARVDQAASPVPSPADQTATAPERPASRPVERHKPSVDAENASRDRDAAAGRADGPAQQSAPPQRTSDVKVSRGATRPVPSPTPDVPPGKQAAADAGNASVVREPQPAVEEGAAAPATVQPVPAQQPTTARGATAVTAIPETTAATQAPVTEPEPSVAAPEVRAAMPPREPKLKKRKGPAPGAVRPIDHPRQRVEIVLAINDLVKRFGATTAVAGITLQVRAGSFFGLVGPNGAGKTTTLSMVTGLLRPDMGSVMVHGADVWSNPVVAKRNMGVLPDSLRLFDRLTGAQLLYYSGVLRGLDAPTVQSRTLDLAEAFGLTDALDRLVTDYSAGMSKKIALAAAMIHSPRLLVLDEPFESVDPVSAANVTEILQRYVAAGGTVVLSSHSMDLIQRICDDVAIVVNGRILASGPVDQVRGQGTLEERFVELAGGRRAAEGMEWLHSFSD